MEVSGGGHASGDEDATSDEDAGTPGFGECLFFRGSGVRLHGIITRDHSCSGERLEQSMRELAVSFNFGGRGQTGAVSLHVTPWASHVHWVHLCRNFHRDCKCAQTVKIRHLGFRIKWKRIERGGGHWERNLLLYLSKSQRYPQQAFYKGKSELAQFLSATIEAKKGGGRASYNSLRCNLDGQEVGDGNGSDDSDAESSVSQQSRGSEGRWHPKKGQAKEIQDIARQLWRLLERKLHPSTLELTCDPEYMELMQPLYYTRDRERMNVTNQVMENFLITWNRKSFQDIIMTRLKTPSTFNQKRYYTPIYSLWLVMKLLRAQCKEPWQLIIDIINIMEKNIPKVNTLSVRGPGGSGKGYFFNSLAELVWSVGQIEANMNRSNPFAFENLLNKRLAILNEFNCSPGQKDNCKELFEGAPTSINVKYKSRIPLPRTPIIITTNNDWTLDFDKIDKEAFRQRCIFYTWTKQPWLKEEEGYPHPLLWSKLVTLNTPTRWEAEEMLYELMSPPKEFDQIHQMETLAENELEELTRNMFLL